MEREDNVAQLFDTADHYDGKPDECDLSREWRQRQDDEREEMLEAALDECKRLGVSREHLKTLVFETGATEWGLRNSLNPPEPKRKCVWPID